jgi:hypothetical protein
MATPTAGLASQTSSQPGQPVNALAANLSGGYILNPATAPGVLMVDPTTAASISANGTTLALAPGQPFYAIPGSTLPVSVASTFPNHKFVSVQWV